MAPQLPLCQARCPAPWCLAHMHAAELLRPPLHAFPAAIATGHPWPPQRRLNLQGLHCGGRSAGASCQMELAAAGRAAAGSKQSMPPSCQAAAWAERSGCSACLEAAACSTSKVAAVRTQRKPGTGRPQHGRCSPGSGGCSTAAHPTPPGCPCARLRPAEQAGICHRVAARAGMLAAGQSGAHSQRRKQRSMPRLPPTHTRASQGGEAHNEKTTVLSIWPGSCTAQRCRL